MKKGYSLIEIMVVMVILMILVGMAIPNYHGYLDRQRAKAAKLTMSTIRAALEVYNLNYEAYPCSSGCPSGSLTKITDLTSLYNILSPQLGNRDPRRDFKPDGFVSYDVTPAATNRPTLYTLTLRARNSPGTLVTASPQVISAVHAGVEIPMAY